MTVTPYAQRVGKKIIQKIVTYETGFQVANLENS